jgi:hypothetical protein
MNFDKNSNYREQIILTFLTLIKLEYLKIIKNKDINEYLKLVNKEIEDENFFIEFIKLLKSDEFKNQVNKNFETYINKSYFHFKILDTNFLIKLEYKSILIKEFILLLKTNFKELIKDNLKNNIKFKKYFKIFENENNIYDSKFFYEFVNFITFFKDFL